MIIAILAWEKMLEEDHSEDIMLIKYDGIITDLGRRSVPIILMVTMMMLLTIMLII